MLISRMSGAWPYCADYSSGKLKVTVDVWECEVYGVFLISQVEQNQIVDVEKPPFGFCLTNEMIQDGLFEMYGIEYQIIVGSILESKYDKPIGQDYYHPLTYQQDYNIGRDQLTYLVFDLPIKRELLKTALDENECLVVATHGNQGLVRYLESDGDDDPEKYEYRTEANSIGWEDHGVTVYTDRYLRDGICEHKIPWTQKVNIRSPKELVASVIDFPFTPIIVFSCVMVLIGFFLIKLLRQKEKQNSKS